MPSTFAKLSIVPAALVVLFLGAPAFAQSQPSNNSDPFSGVTAVDSEHMSAVSGGVAGGTGTSTSTPIGTGDCGAGAQCGGGVQGNAIGTTTRDVSASVNKVRINVTAINNQTSIVGPGVINTGGGSNTAGGGN